MPPAFADRRDAGRRLAEQLVAELADQIGAAAGAEPAGSEPGAAAEPAGPEAEPAGTEAGGAPAARTGPGDRPAVVVLGLPRGGVPVAAEVAEALGAELDVLVVGKVGVPGHEELALAAVADDGSLARNPNVIAAVGMSEEELEVLARRQAAALVTRAGEFRGGRSPVGVAGRTVVVVDDGMATGATMRVAVEVVRSRGPAQVVVAIPVASMEATDAIRAVADRVVCLLAPPGFRAVGPWYADFTQVTDEEVRELLGGC
jgi:putative phosphoribosyl transferase